MKLTKEQIQSTETIGKTQDGDDIVHVLTKGGLNLLVKKKDGDFKILSSGAHRGVARFQANQLEKGILWNQSLYKSEKDRLPEQDSVEVVESTPDKHTIMAVYHTFQATLAKSTDEKLAFIDSALAHFKAAGLNYAQANETMKKTQTKLQKNYRMDEPYNSDMLKVAYEVKNKKPFPSGIE